MATIKGSDYADDIKDAIKTLSTRVDEFDSEARVCDSERLGEVRKDGVRTRIAIESIQELLEQTKQEKEFLYERIQFLESQAAEGKKHTKSLVSGLREDMVQEELQIAVYNAFYGLFMAHPNVDDRTGKRESLDPIVDLLCKADFGSPAIAKPESFGFLALQSPPQRQNLEPNSIHLWLEELAQPSSDSSYLEQCLENVWDLSLKDMDRVKYVMASAELGSWLRSSRSTTLVIDSETRPAEVFNALTSSIAIVTQTLISEAKFPVLSFFCGLHANEVYDEQSSGPMGMLNCLNAQLMSYFKERDLHMTVYEQLKKPKFRRRSQTSVSKSLGLLESLFRDLPEEDPVVVVIDSVCRLLGSRPLANEAIRGLVEVARRADRKVKILITSPWSTDELGLNNFMELYIPDYIDGDREGLNLELVRKDAAEAASASTSKAKVPKVQSSDDSDSTSTSDSESDDGW